MLLSYFFQHETKKNILKKFLLVLGIVLVYFIFLSFRYGIENSLVITFLTWSFFVLCTPIADAGFLLDFPLRLLTGVKMMIGEATVWTISILLNLYFIFNNPLIYEKTALLRLFRKILLNPFPFWLIIILSAIGTFLSIYFGDELIDVARHSEREKHQKHRKKHYFIILLFLLVLIFFLYDYLLNLFGFEF